MLGLNPFESVDDLRREIEQGYQPNQKFATQYGIDHEALGRYYYQKLKQQVVTPARFVVDQRHPRIRGCGDGLIGTESGLEIKCHVSESNLLTKVPLPERYIIQMVGICFYTNGNNGF